MKQSKFLLFLLNEFERRKSINCKYSLRAYARHLQISPSILSRILRGKIIITEEMFSRFVVPLGLDQKNYEEFLKDVKYFRKKRNGHVDSSIIYKIDNEEFVAIQDWYHFAILELCAVDNFKPTKEYISSRLSISKELAQAALNRLLELGQLKKEPNGKLVPSQEYTTTTHNKFTTLALKNRQRQVLSRAIESLDIIEIEKRDQRAMTVALDSDLLPDIKEQIKNFNRSLANYIETRSQKKDQVYEFSTSLFPWTN